MAWAWIHKAAHLLSPLLELGANRGSRAPLVGQPVTLTVASEASLCQPHTPDALRGVHHTMSQIS